MEGDKGRGNRKINFLRNNLQPCTGNLHGDMHYLALPHLLILGEIQNKPLCLLKSCVRIRLARQVKKHYLGESG